VLLRAGTTVIRVEGTDAQGGVASTTVSVQSSTPSEDSILIAAPEFTGTVPADVHLLAKPAISLGTIAEYRFDVDGDGVIDVSQASGTLLATYREERLYWPRAFVRTNAGVLIPLETPRGLRAVTTGNATTRSDTALATVASDVAWDLAHQRLVVLSGALTVFANDGSTVFSSSSVNRSNCSAVATDHEGNVYCVHPLEARVLRLLAASDYAPDLSLSAAGSFGLQGSEVSFFSGPRGVSVGDEGTESRIYVADTNNLRIQRFSAHAEFELAFDGSGGNVALGAVTTIAALRDTSLAVVDVSGTNLMLFDADGNRLPAPSYPAFQRVVDVFETIDGLLGVADAGAGEVVFLQADGMVARSISVPVPFEACAYRVVGGREQMVVADAGSPRLVTLTLSTSTDDAEPVRVVNAFVAALRTGDLSAAERLVTASARERLAALDEPRARDVAASIRNPTVTNLTQHSAIVIATTGSATAPQLTEFELRRSAHDSCLRITAF
jgi:hypothetical protein